MSIDWNKLKAPFPENEIEWRVGRTSSKGSVTLLCYVTARAVMNRLDDVVGPENWQANYEPVTLGKETGFLCTLKVWTGATWIEKADVSDCTDIEPLKGGVSGAFKRAAVLLGIGRYLYDLGCEDWLQVQDGWPPRGSNAISCKKGDGPGHVFPPKLPAWALPAERVVERPDGSVKIEELPKPKETPEEKAARQATHHASFTLAVQKKFNGDLKKLGFEYEEIKALCEFLKRPWPSQMDPEQREKLLAYLATTQGADAYNRYLDSKGAA